MAKINWSFLWEAFAIASGVPPSTWQSVPGHKVEVATPKIRVHALKLKPDSEELDLTLLSHSPSGNHYE